MKLKELEKRGLWFWIKYPIYIITDLLGIMNHFDRWNFIRLFIRLIEKQTKLEKRIEKLEKANGED